MADFDPSSIWEGAKEFLGEYGVPIAVGGQAASVYLKNLAAKKAQAAQQAFIEQERARQAEAAAQARSTFAATAPQFTPAEVEARRRAAEAKLASTYAPPAAVSPVTQNYQQVVQQNQPVAVQGDLTRNVSAALDEGRANASRLALLRSFGATQANDAMTLNRSAEDIARAGRDAKASAAILPYELHDAGHAGDKLLGLSDGVGAASGIAGLYAMTRRPKPAPKPAPFFGVGASPY